MKEHKKAELTWGEWLLWPTILTGAPEEKASREAYAFTHTCNRGDQCWFCVDIAWLNLTFRACLQYIQTSIWQWSLSVTEVISCKREVVQLLFFSYEKQTIKRWKFPSLLKSTRIHSHLFSVALCFVVSAGCLTPRSEIGYAHCGSPSQSPVKKKEEKNNMCLVIFNSAAKSKAALNWAEILKRLNAFSHCSEQQAATPPIKTRMKDQLLS